MPLELVTGPANAEKAGYVLDGVRRAAVAGPEPLLVVPTRSDVDAYRRELAADGVALGVNVVDFAELLREMARRSLVVDRPLGATALERVAASVAAELLAAGRLTVLTDAAGTAGFATALSRICGEVAQARCDPRRFALAMTIWGKAERREAFAADLAALNGAYVGRLERLGCVDPARHAWSVLDALRLNPACWSRTPVFLYGFDDLTDVQLDAVRTLSEHVDAQVVVSLPFEARTAFAGRHRTWHELCAMAGNRVADLGARDVHYAAASRRALHGLERGLFEVDPEKVDPGAAIELLEGGGPRAELELVAQRVRGLLEAGFEPEQIAIALRDAGDAAALVETVFLEAGIPVAHERWITMGRTALGRGLLALVRCALLDGGSRDLLTWLRSPGGPGGAGRRVDALEKAVREQGLAELDDALADWERLGGHELRPIGRLREARARGSSELYDALLREAARTVAAPHRTAEAGNAPILGPAQQADAAMVGRLARALDALRELERRDARLAPGDDELYRAIEAIEVPVGERARPGTVIVADPLALRARRVRALFLGRLQEGVFPRPGRGEPFLGDHERIGIDRALADAGQAPLGLRPHEDPLDAERYQLYAAVSRPTELLVLSWHRADEDGEPLVRSPFVDDVLDVLEPVPTPRDRRLGSVGWEPGDAVSRHQRALSDALSRGEQRLRGSGEDVRQAGLGSRHVLAALESREAWSATELELYARCPVRWFVERLLKPGTIDPDAEPLGRGAVGHEALERTLRELAAAGERLEPATLARSIVRLRVHLRESESANPISSDPRRRLAEVGRLEADLVRYLEHAAAVGSSLAPADFEFSFGVAGSSLPAVDLDGLSVRGRIDRIDRSEDGSQAIIIDYKGRAAPAPADKWLREGLLQAGLYARALERLEEASGTRVVGAVYQPIGADPRMMDARGFVEAGADMGADHRDRITAEVRDRLLDDLLEEARRVVQDVQAGRLRPRPDRCSWNDAGCAHPSICRCEA